MYLSIVIPAYNEAKRIGPTLQSVGDWLGTQSFDGEVIVVNNRSVDTTADVVREYMRRYPFIRLVDERRPGKGYAVAAGMLFAAGQVRLFMDADNSTSIDHFAECKGYVEKGYDVVVGSLAVPGATIVRGGEEPLWRVWLGKLGNQIIQRVAVPGIQDTQRGFKVFSAEAARAIFSRLTTFGWGFDIEVLAIAQAKKYRIKEVPVTWNNGPDSKVDLWDYPKTLAETFRIGWNKVRGYYT